MKLEEKISVILVERDYKGVYERFALTPEEFREEYPEIFEGKPVDFTVCGRDTYTVSPLVHIWYTPCILGDRTWNKFFTDMTWELPTIDVECGNIAYVRKDMMKSLLKYLPEATDVYKHKVRIDEVLSRIVEVNANTATEAVNTVMRRYYNCDIILDSSDMYEVTFTTEEI